MHNNYYALYMIVVFVRPKLRRVGIDSKTMVVS